MVNKLRLEQNTSMILYNQKFNITHIYIYIDYSHNTIIFCPYIQKNKTASQRQGSDSRNPWVFPMKKIGLSGVNFPLASNQSID